MKPIKLYKEGTFPYWIDRIETRLSKIQYIKVYIALIIVCVLIIGVGIGTVHLAKSGSSEPTLWVDPDTGVNYFVTYDGLYPRYNSDGTLVVTEIEEENHDN